MADISALGQLQSAEPIDLDLYPTAQESTFRLPPKGRYVVRAPEAFPPEAFGATNEKLLLAQIDPTIVGPTGEGTVIKFTKVSAKTFKRGNENASRIGDYLAACGITGKLTEPQELADAIERTAGSTYEVILDWRAFDKTTRQEIKGMENFPLLADGTHQPYIESTTEKDNEGRPVRTWANLNVVRFIPATS